MSSGPHAPEGSCSAALANSPPQVNTALSNQLLVGKNSLFHCFPAPGIALRNEFLYNRVESYMTWLNSLGNIMRPV